MAKYDNKGSLWARVDGAKAAVGADRSAPLFSGVINVGGTDYQLSAWHGNPKNLDEDAKAAIVAFRKAAIQLGKALGSDYTKDKPGGAPGLKLTVSERYGNKKSKPSGADGLDLSDAF